MKNDRIRDCLDACLKDVHVSAALHDEVMSRVKGTAPARATLRPGKLIVAIAVVLMLLVTTAVALTISELVRQEMEPVKEFHVELSGRDDWLLEDKLYYVTLMEDWGFPLDEAKLDALRSGELSEDEQELLAGEIIWDCVGEHMLAVHGETVDPANAPEPYPIPDNDDLYEMLWLMNDSEADPAVIRASYDEWQMELHAALPAATAEPESMTAEQKREALLLDVDNYMADVMSMSRREREAAAVTAEFHEEPQVWMVKIRVHEGDLREITRNWFDVRMDDDVVYDSASGVYTFSIVFTAEGRVADAASLEEYEWNSLIPREAWPEMPEAYAEYPYFDPLKCFLYASSAEKAAFSQTWKPVVDAWLQEHPAYRAKLAAEGGSNPLYRITRHDYGTPPPNALQEADVLEIAIAHSLAVDARVTQDMLENRFHHVVYYDVCAPGRPLWKVELSWDAERILPGEPMAEFLLIIDPVTGKVLQDQRTLTLEDALDW